MRDFEYAISEARENDLKDIEEFFKGQDSMLRDTKLLHWKYLDNPAGKAHIFLIRDEESKIIGALSFLPRVCVRRNAGRVVIMQAVDALIAPEARGQSLYDKLVRYSTGRIGMPIYGFPNKIAERVEVRNGWKILVLIDSWYFPINMGLLLSNSKVKVVSPLLNLIFKIYACLWLSGKQNNIELRKINEFKDDFCVKGNHFYIERTSQFLNWRFINNPIRIYFCYEFHNRGGSIGYCVYAVEETTAVIYDFVSNEDQRVCWRKIVEHLRVQKITHVVFKCVGINLGKFGFIKRKLGASIISYNMPSGRWFFTLCDSDWD